MTLVQGIALALAGLSLFGAACDASSRPNEEETAAQGAAPEADLEQVSADDPVSKATHSKVRLERAQRALDRGDARAAEEELERMLDAGEVVGEERDEALLALSRACELNGDEEGAIDAVERILIANAASERFESQEVAERRLRLLLTGAEETSNIRLPASADLPPMTWELADFFEQGTDGRVLVDVYTFGRPSRERGGIYDIAEAKRFKLDQDLSRQSKVSQSISGAGSWLALPKAIGVQQEDMPQADRSMLVFYYDLGDNRVPSRYDEYLPIPSEEIAATLEKGQGLVAARKREHGKPVIVIAAPRMAQLEAVEEVFSQMTEMPFTPVAVPLTPKLMPGEIQGTVRASFGSLRKCYETALETDKTMEGKIVLSFEIDRDGYVSSGALGEGTTLREPTFVQCMLRNLRELKFPASGEKTKVTYPIVMSP